jgi:hypothetical protein
VIGLTRSTARIEQSNVLHRLEVMAAITPDMTYNARCEAPATSERK